MSRLIKAAAAELAVRPLALNAADGGKASGSPPPEPVDPRLTELESENAQLREALAAALDAAAQAEIQAFDAAHAKAAEVARTEEAKRLEALADGIDAALAAWTERLDSLERLAPLLARTALSKLFEPCDDQADLVARAIARQMSGLRRQTAVQLRVSARDFAGDADLAILAERAGAGTLAITRDPELALGDCRLDLSLGHVELGPRAQWRELSTLLEALACGEDVT